MLERYKGREEGRAKREKWKEIKEILDKGENH
jgi:hypothetical protein